MAHSIGPTGLSITRYLDRSIRITSRMRLSMKTRLQVFLMIVTLGSGTFAWFVTGSSEAGSEQGRGGPIVPPVITTPAGSAAVEQREPGTSASATMVTSFDGLGLGFEGPQGNATFRNPSDNSLAVGTNHVFQIVNSRMAIYDKKGKVLYGPVNTNTVFKDFGGACEANNNGDAVVRYDQLADRWLVVMPIFRRGSGVAGEPTLVSQPGRPDQPGPAYPL